MSKVVLVTGCSSGFGHAIAASFAARGDRVIATVRGEGGTGLPPAAASATGGSLTVRSLDVTDAESIRRLAKDVDAEFGALDVLVNNAGISVVGALEAVSEHDYHRVFATNVFGAVAVTKAFLPAMRAQGRGRVVFMSAIGALLNTPYMGVYTASKHAVDSIAAAWDIELRPFGIRVASILPGAFNTALAGNMGVVTDQPGYDEPTRRYLAGLLGRIRTGPTDLTPVVEAVHRAVDEDDPRPRYLVGAGMAESLAPLAADLAVLHDDQLAMTAALWAADGEVESST